MIWYYVFLNQSCIYEANFFLLNSYALELRDKGEHGFMLPVMQIKPTVEETWTGITGMALEIAKQK